MNFVDCIEWQGQPLAYIIRAEINPEKTAFVTPPECTLQVGFVVYPEKGIISRHLHRAIERSVLGTSEVIVVKKGHCQVDIYNDKQMLVAERKLRGGDILHMVGGGHGFKMMEDTVLLEIKQGPYPGIDEKERF